MSLRISVNCFGISIDCFGLSRIKKRMILIITVNLSTGIISVYSVRFALSAYLRNAKAILSLRRLSRMISLPRKNVKPIFFFWGGGGGEGGSIFPRSRFIKAIISIHMYIVRSFICHPSKYQPSKFVFLDFQN